MTDLSKNSVNVQGKRAVCIYNYKATMNDEVSDEMKFKLLPSFSLIIDCYFDSLI